MLRVDSRKSLDDMTTPKRQEVPKPAPVVLAPAVQAPKPATIEPVIHSLAQVQLALLALTTAAQSIADGAEQAQIARSKQKQLEAIVHRDASGRMVRITVNVID